MSTQSVNKVTIIGRMGKDAELKTFENNGNSVANFSVATTEKFKNSQGEKQENTQWHNIAAWGKLAEIVSKYSKKGDMVYIQGRLNTRSYEDAQGVKKYVTEIVAEEFTILAKKQEAVTA